MKNEYTEHFTAGAEIKSVPLNHVLPASIERKLRSQMSTMGKAISSSIKLTPINANEFTSNTHLKELEAVAIRTKVGRFSYAKAGHSRLFVSYRSRRVSLSKALISPPRTDLSKKLNGLTNVAISIMHRDSKDNCIFVSSVIYDEKDSPFLLPGMIPAFWWPVSIDVLYDLIFGNLTILSIYNPAHVWERLRESGFDVKIGPRSTFVSVEARRGEKVVNINKAQYFNDISKYFIIDDDTVVELIEKAIDSAFRGEKSFYARIAISATTDR